MKTTQSWKAFSISTIALNKTVLQVIPTMDLGGAERTTVEMTRAIVAAGGRAIVATSGGRLCDDVIACGGEVERLPVASKNPLVIWQNIERLRSLFDRRQVDLVHVRSRAPAWSCLFAAQKSRLPLVTTYHGAYGGQSSFKRFLNSSMVRSDRVIANSEFTAGAIAVNYKDVENRMITIPRGADLTQFCPSKIGCERILKLEKDWGISRKGSPDPGRNIFLMPARMSEWKGHKLVISALKRLKEGHFYKNSPDSVGATGQRRKLTVVFVGDDEAGAEYVESLQSEIEEFGVREMTSFVGHCADMPAAYSLADAVLSPSLRPEAFGRVAVEAGAMSKIAIVADHGGARETVVDGVTGFRHRPADSEDLARKMANVLEMPRSMLDQMGDAARDNVQRNFSIDAMTNATLKVYASLLDASGGLKR